MRSIIGDTALAEDPDGLERQLTGLLAGLLEDTPPSTGPAPGTTPSRAGRLRRRNDADVLTA
ncbi:hypothetical protein AB0L10_41950 [Streptomyces flaveolus]|uniref:hypothetical protein n=1 Tax=Streptomyces flaveolus TaxID=67297 RepID=UPI0034463773